MKHTGLFACAALLMIPPESEAMKMSVFLQELAAGLIPSKDLREAIRGSGFVLSDITLLATVFRCAPDFAARIEYLKLLEEAFTGELKEYTARLIRTQQQMLEAFLAPVPGSIYELHIRELPYTNDETYLCGSFEAAVKLIELFKAEYGAEDDALLCCKIVKRRIFCAGEGEAFGEDYIADAELLDGGKIYSVAADGYSAQDCELDCPECKQPCIHGGEILYPCFIRDGDLVRYRQFGEAEHYGICFHGSAAPTDEYYIIPLDCEQVRCHDFEHAWYGHEHISCVYVERATEGSLPEEVRRDYLAYRAFLKENPF